MTKSPATSVGLLLSLGALICATYVAPVVAQAQSSSRLEASSSTATTSTKRRRFTKRDAPYYQLGTGLVMWQEPIGASKAGAKADLETQSLGAKISMTHNHFFPKSRWRKVYSGDAMFGTIKGKSFGNVITDELNKQPWLAVQGSAGLVYRTEPASEVGIFVPAILRYIKWDLQGGTALKMERETSFSFGLGGIYTNRFSPRNAMNITVTHQQMWKATVWAISWEQTL